MFLNKMKNTINQNKKKIALSLAVLIATMTIVPSISNLTTKGEVFFGTQHFPDDVVAEWDKIAKMTYKDAKRTDMELFMCDAKSTAMQRLMTQTGGTKLSEWKDYEWKSTYCVAHDVANMTGGFTQYPVWYSFGYYTVQDPPKHFIKTDNAELKKFNFLMLAYATNYENYIGGPNSDPYLNTANFYTMQLIAGLCETAEYTGDYQHDYDITKSNVFSMAEGEFHPNSLGSNRIYEDMTGNFDRRFNSIWNTAKLLSECSESTDEGYTYKAEKLKGDDGMTQVHLTYSDKLRDIIMSSKITTYGDWTYEFTPEYINFKSPTGDMPTEGKIAEVDAVGAANTIGKHIGTESVMSIRTPAKLKNGTYTFMRTQENMVTCLKDGLKIIISDGPSTEIPEGDYQMFRYKHSENWDTNYTINLRKLDSETGKPLEGAKFDILEAFDDSQITDVLEDDNWDNDDGSQFDTWNGWDAPEGNGGDDPCTKDEEITDEDGWLTGMTSIGGGSLTSDGKRAHNDTKSYSYTKGFCGGHPIPEFVEIPEPEYAEPEEGEEASDEVINQDEIDAAKAENDSLLKAYMSDIQLCFDLEDEGGYFCKADESGISVNIQDSYGYESKEEYESECIQIEDAKDELEADRDDHYVDFISLEYQYSARELEPREGYIIHNKDNIHDVDENIDDTVHTDTIPIETVTVRSSEYYDYLDNGIEHDSGGGSDPDEESVDEEDTVEAFNTSNITSVVKTATSGLSDTDSEATITVSSDSTNKNDFEFEDTTDIPDEMLSDETETKMSELIASDSNAEKSLKSRMIRSVFDLKASDDLESRNARGGARSSTQWTEPSIANNIVPGDSGYDGKGNDWEFIVYDHRTEGEVHFNKRDLDLKAHESDKYDTYGNSQGDGTLEGAVYGLFATADINHPDGKTGVVFEKDNLVAVATTDRNGNGSFMAITEIPGSIFNGSSGSIEKTGFTGPTNLYIEDKEQHSSNGNRWNNSQWYYPIENNQSNNGNCWIGRPLFLGSYYIKELTRSEGYELSVYGANAEDTNRDAHLNGGTGLVNGTAEITRSQAVYRSNDDGTTEQIYEVEVSSKGTTGGYDVYLQGVNTDREPEFYISEKGTKEVYKEWIEKETVYEPVLAIPGNQVIIGGKSVEAVAGDPIRLPNGETVIVNAANKIEVTPAKIKKTGPSSVIPNISTKIIPDLSKIEIDDFVNECNKAFEKISPNNVGKEAPYVLVELGNDNTKWAEKLHDYLSSDAAVAFSTARVEKTTMVGGNTYAVLRYSFMLNTNVQDIVFVNHKNAFYQKYNVTYSDGTDGYLYKEYLLSGINTGDYLISGSAFNWVMLPNEVPDKAQITLYEDLTAIPYKNNQQFKSLWVYAEGEYQRDNDGNIYQKPVEKEVKKSGYVSVDTYIDTLVTGEFVDGMYKIHITQEQIPADGKLTLTVKYKKAEDYSKPSYQINATVSLSVDTAESYIKPVTLVYPNDVKKVFSDANTRVVPIGVLERPIRQRVKIVKNIETLPDTDEYLNDTYSKVHKDNSIDAGGRYNNTNTDWLTNLIHGKDETKATSKLPGFQFKAYLKSNLERLYRDENGTIVWIDRNGNPLIPEYLDANVNGNYDAFTWNAGSVDFPEENKLAEGILSSANVQKIFTKVEHNLNSTTTGDISNNTWAHYEDPQTTNTQNVGEIREYNTSHDNENGEAIKTNGALYSYQGKNINVEQTDKINNQPNTGYTRLLEMRLGTGTAEEYNYEKFFDAMAAANSDKWDNDMFASNKNYPGQHWFDTFEERYQMDDADADGTLANTDGVDADGTAGGDKDTSFKPFQWIREGIFGSSEDVKNNYPADHDNANIENKINTSDVAHRNSEASDKVRQFAITWYLDDEVAKLVKNNGYNEDVAKSDSMNYQEEVYDLALEQALIKAYNYLKPFYEYDLDTIYSVLWDGTVNGGVDKDLTTLSADTLYETDDKSGYYYGVSAYLPYGTYVLVEQQPTNFENKNYKTDKPKELMLPAVYEENGNLEDPEQMNRFYNYDSSDTPEDLAKKYMIRFNEEWADNHTDDLRKYVIRAHNFDGDYEVYKYGLDVDKLTSTITYSGGNYTYNGFNITQEVNDPLKDYYNDPLVDEKPNGGNSLNHYPSDDKDYPHDDAGNNHYKPDEIEKRYHYGSISEHDGIDPVNGKRTMTGNQTAYEGKYASMLVPWSVVEPADSDVYDITNSTGYTDGKFQNTFYTSKLRIEKLDSETGEQILHDDAIFAIYAAARNDDPNSDGSVLFYEEDTLIKGSQEFLQAMGATNIQPIVKNGVGDQYTGIVKAGTPVCFEEDQVVLTDETGNRTGTFKVFSTNKDELVLSEKQNGKEYANQNVGYLVTPQPLGAGVYVLAEINPPNGYSRTAPVAIEVYSDKVSYYLNGDKNNKVIATIYEKSK